MSLIAQIWGEATKIQRCESCTKCPRKMYARMSNVKFDDTTGFYLNLLFYAR